MTGTGNSPASQEGTEREAPLWRWLQRVVETPT